MLGMSKLKFLCTLYKQTKVKAHKHLYNSYKKKYHYIIQTAKAVSMHNTIPSSHNITNSVRHG